MAKSWELPGAFDAPAPSVAFGNDPPIIASVPEACAPNPSEEFS